ncbi:MAG: leucine-rich repeat domain-containing protein, partial [Clostridia bacterium]|nr:leucine-rich repeat domain-containing protein [Clostridia bacterium]
GDEHFENLVVPRSLKTVHITERITDIAAGAFHKIYGLQNVIFDYPDSIRTVGESAFDGCMNLGYDSDLGVAYKFDWLKNVREIGANAFRAYTGNYNSEIKSLFIFDDDDPNYVATLIENPYPFTSMTSIPALTAAETIGERAFYYQSAIDSIEFGNSLRTIGDYAFMYCLSAPSLHFPATLQSIGVQAFMANMSVLEMTFEAGNTGINIGTYAFAFCTSLAQIVFEGQEPPQLGLNVFNNDMEQTADGYKDLFTEFRIFVPKGAEETFRTQMLKYATYIEDSREQIKPAYWRDTNGNIDVKFEFTDGSIVYVTDPEQNFITSIDYLNFGDPTYGATCGTYYPMLYEVIDEQTYTKLAMEGSGGKHAKPLYANQKLVRLWHPDLVAYDGSMLSDLYFFITEEKYVENGTSYLLPILQKTSYGSTRGDTSSIGDYVFLTNRFGILQIGTVTMNGGVYGVKPIDEPEGTYFSLYESTGGAYMEGTVFYTFNYYNDKYEIIQSDVYAVEQTWSSSRVRKVPADSDYYRLDISSSYNEANSLLLDGIGGARVTYNDVNYTLYVGPQTQKEIGEEGYTVSLYDDKACTKLRFTVTFSDWYKGSYLLASLEGSEIKYDFYNVYADGDWYYPHDYDHITDTRFMYPKDSGSLYDYDWRYTRWTEQTIDATIKVYALSVDGYETFEYGYFREYHGAYATASTRVAYGKVVKNGDGTLKFVYSDGTEKVGNIVDNRGSFKIGETKYTYFDDSDDVTLVFTEEFYGTPLYYYTVKLDSYGNMYYIDEHDDDIYDIYVGTFDSYSHFGSYYEIEFHGKKIDKNGKEIVGAPELTLWVLYDFNTLAAWSDDYEADAQWYGTLAAINESRDDTVITVYDDFGYKIYEVTVDIYGETTFTAYEYSINRRGYIVYTEVEDANVSRFVAVYGGVDVAYCIAIDENGRALFSVRPSLTNSEVFVISRDSGLSLPSAGKADSVTIDVSQLEEIK